MGVHDEMNRCQAYTLYLNHALSTWNARSYEFAAILFTASAYPEGLRAASLVGISTSLAAICFGSAIGRWIDHGASRLRTLLATIAINRCAIVAACLLWFFIVGRQASKEPGTETDGEASGSTSILHGTMKTVAFSLLLLLGIIESLSRKANVISIEQDWVPVLAPVATPGGYTLTHINAMMARVDMICKLIAPIAVSWFLSAVSTRVGVVVVALTNGFSFAAELWSAKKLWNQCPWLSERKTVQTPDNPHHPASENGFSLKSSIEKASTLPAAYLESLKFYFSSDVCMPSLAMCVTHASVLSITSVTVVFLLDSGYSLRLVTAGEAFSALFEISSTLFMPFAVRRMMSTMTPQEEEDDDVLAKSPILENAAQFQSVDVAISRIGLSGVVSMASVLVGITQTLTVFSRFLTFFLASSCANPDIPHSRSSISTVTHIRQPHIRSLSHGNFDSLLLSRIVSLGPRNIVPLRPATRSISATVTSALLIRRHRDSLHQHVWSGAQPWNCYME